ncbi:hypothetical protein [Aquimarina sediminis]|uniref:hypothetical protein n=1 Tax=Aquimarina sediminis TaxID=2070536 RepID=UPI000CA00767|nr:hypothetical protein [Aquimarina sediminis]
MMTKIINRSVLLLLIALSSCNSDDDQNVTSIEIPQSITINSSGLFPEGIVYDDVEKVFYTSSVNLGKISKVALDGTTTDFITENGLVSTLGLTIDKQNRRLIVCNTDPGFGVNSTDNTLFKLANVLIFDLDTKDKLADYDLSDLVQGETPNLVNDAVVGGNGYIYVTNSVTPAIYKIDPRSRIAEVFVVDERFTPIQGFGLNGLVYHPDGYILVGHYDSGSLYKIPENFTNPDEIIKVELSEPVNTIDGIEILSSTEIAVASNGAGEGLDRVYRISTSDNWINGSVIGSFDAENSFPTTMSLTKDGLYVLKSYLPFLLPNNPNQDTLWKEYIIERVSF